jgi:hypothetical protein
MARLTAISRVLEGVARVVTLDGNEQYASAGAFADFFAQFTSDPQLAPLLACTAFVEQPLRRDQALAQDVSALAKHIPLLVDESDATLDAFVQARSLGYTGVSSKSCKGFYKSVINAARCALWNQASPGAPYFLSGEDLTMQAGLGLQQDLALVSWLGLAHVERNGHHYVNGLMAAPEVEQQNLLLAHDTLYEYSFDAVRLRIKGGQIALGALDTPGFATGQAGGQISWDAMRSSTEHHPISLTTATRNTHEQTHPGHHHARRDRPHGHQPAPDPFHPGDTRPGRRAAVRRQPRHARPHPDRPQRRQGRGAGPRARRGPLGHRPGPGAGQPRRHDLLRRRHHADAPHPAGQGDTRRQARLLRKADRHQPQRGRRNCPPGAKLGPEARRGAGQALPARPAQARHAAPRRLLRQDAVGAPGVRLLGVRRRPAAHPAPKLELPQRRRRRHDPGHDVPLALCAGQPVRRGQIRLLHGRHPHSRALGRSRQSPTRPPPTTRPMQRRNSQATTASRSSPR